MFGETRRENWPVVFILPSADPAIPVPYEHHPDLRQCELRLFDDPAIRCPRCDSTQDLHVIPAAVSIFDDLYQKRGCVDVDPQCSSDRPGHGAIVSLSPPGGPDIVLRHFYGYFVSAAGVGFSHVLPFRIGGGGLVASLDTTSSRSSWASFLSMMTWWICRPNSFAGRPSISNVRRYISAVSASSRWSLSYRTLLNWFRPDLGIGHSLL